MNYKLGSYLPSPWCFALLLTLAACDSSNEAEPQVNNSGPVRSVQLKTSGSISGEFSPADESKTKLVARCDSGDFAIFTILFRPAEGWRQVGASVQTKDAIKAGQTGPVEIDWVLITFTDDNYDATEFRGPAEFVINSNDINAPRLSATIKGQIPGYGGIMATEKVEPDRSIDFKFDFDLNFACGLTG